MKKVIALMSILGVLTFTNLNGVMAQKQTKSANDKATTEQKEQKDAQTNDTMAPTDTTAIDTAAANDAIANQTEVTEKTFTEVLKEKYIQGGAGWMTPVLICLLFGMAFVIERIIYLFMATTDANILLEGIEDKVSKGDYEGAKELCRNTRGPVASIFYQGLDRIDMGLEDVEKALTAYGGVQMARLENNMTWISLAIALAPSFGFLGTVIGMVQAFDDIEVAGDISPTVVAGGMKVALLTTIFGLIAAIILQFFFNFLLTKIESLVAQMEDSSITFMDILVKYRK